MVSLAPPIDRMENSAPANRFRFGEFELDTSAGELRRNGDRLRIQPQPYRLLTLLVRRAGELVARDEIRQELWKDGTFVDFEQSVNFCVSQIREVLKDSADRPIYVQTVPKRGYRFIAPVETGEPQKKSGSDGTTVRLQKALWTNIAELKLAEERRRQQLRVAIIAGLVVLIVALIAFVVLTNRQESRPAGKHPIAARRNSPLRRARRACEGAARGVGPPQATEPGCGAEPHVRRMSRRV